MAASPDPLQQRAALLAFVRSLIVPLDEEPEEENYDDTESAYWNGIEVADWDTSQKARALLAELGEPSDDA